MKKGKTVINSFLIIVIVFLSFSNIAFAASEKGSVNNIANIRAAAVSGKVLRKLSKGAEVSILEEKSGWYRIADAKKRTGWVAEWLVDKKSVQKAAVKNAEVKVVKKAKVLFASRVRKAPAVASGNIITTLYPGETVHVTGEQGDWYAVSFASTKNGWVAKELVEVSTAKAAPATSAVLQKATSSAIIATDTPIMTGLPGISIEAINGYWLQKVNALRKEKGLRELVTSDIFVRTADEWSKYMASSGNITHEREDGKSMHAWIDERGLIFSDRNSEGGWKANYFSENIAYQMNTTPDSESVNEALDSVLNAFLREGESGVHYRTTYHPDWNSVGVGVSSIKDAKGRYTSYFTFHYGSLSL